ncbi:MAG TPA: DUF2252 family protein [Candidatus Acidoferrales bacterium]|nr:DUF2252 family protein [Candidatus Acidoferrales bacterium]
MDIHKATASYEKWMMARTTPVAADLAFKHKQMAEAVFPFLRATFYRWVQLWEEVCADLAAAPSVLAVGDLHVENFGTWRDSEGRLIWGVNDFDEAYPAAYTIDLVRLATSARIAAQEEHLSIRPKEACEAILDGYTKGLRSRGKPFVLSEHHIWLREIALNELRDPVLFWKKTEAWAPVQGKVPAEARRLLEEQLPGGIEYRLKRRVAGLGSLGHQRLLALAQWRGGFVAREAKALLPSAFVWQAGRARNETILYEKIVTRSVRMQDPFVHVSGDWLVRRLAPDCSRIELSSLPKKRDEASLLHAMGWETANIHLGSSNAISAVERDLKKRPARWLRQAAKKMSQAVTRQWEDWVKG